MCPRKDLCLPVCPSAAPCGNEVPAAGLEDSSEEQPLS